MILEALTSSHVRQGIFILLRSQDFKASPQSTKNTLRTPSPSLSKAGARKLSTSGEKANVRANTDLWNFGA